MVLDFMELKRYIAETGVKRKVIAERSGVPEIHYPPLL